MEAETQKVFTGTIVMRKVSDTPCVQLGTTLIPIHLDQDKYARKNIGASVAFKVLDRPYGQHITTEQGVAKLISKDH